MPITYFFKKVNFYLPTYILLNLFVGGGIIVTFLFDSLYFHHSVVTNSVMY